ncbi:MAG: glycosyltransferase, partial [Chitinophagaceae bacterium]
MRGDENFDFCLLIPCYNNLQGLLHSIQSVVYAAGKYCIVIVDDGSAEPVTGSHLKDSVNDETHLVILRNESNLGIT